MLGTASKSFVSLAALVWLAGCSAAAQEPSAQSSSAQGTVVPQSIFASPEFEAESKRVIARGAPAYFRSYDAMVRAMNQLAAANPTVAKAIVIGASHEVRPMMALRIGEAPKNGKTKPVVLWTAGSHAREIAPPEFLMRWATDTLAAYANGDPNAKAALRDTTIFVVPVVNPDGHAIVEDGYATKDASKVWQRKNANEVDLNRNYPMGWQIGGQDTANPTDRNYKGASAGSEKETQVMMRFIQNIAPDLLIDWHSFSRVVLHPFGHTADTTVPHAAGLDALGDAMACQLAGYDSGQTSAVFSVTGGSMEDWAFGQLKLNALSIETGMPSEFGGTLEGFFHFTDADFKSEYESQGVKRALDYSVEIAKNPAKAKCEPQR